VTKGFVSNERLLEVLYAAGVRVFSDSRVATGKKINIWAKTKKKEIKSCLLRPPSAGEALEAVAYFDRFYISDVSHALLIDEAAKKANRQPELILMVETGDRREGFLEEELEEALAFIQANCTQIKVRGFGTNTTCLNRSRPDAKDIIKIVELSQKHFGKNGLPSPGNSGALYLLKHNQLPYFKGELRIGEAILLGNETVNYQVLPGLTDETFLLAAEVIEIRKKLYDKIQVVVALGKADVGDGKLFPTVDGLVEVRRSSDHLVLMIEGNEDEVLGRIKKSRKILFFKPTYFALLQAWLTPTVYKIFVEESLAWKESTLAQME
jgi:predicted amino acid racemase